MSRRRWIADEYDEARAALVGEHAGHLARVLRARVGQEFEVAAGGRVRRGRVTRVADDRVEFELGEEVGAAVEADVTLALAVIKFERFEWAVEKLTELGVRRVVPVVTGRTAAHLAGAAEKRVERWRRIAQEAAEQSRRAAPPEIAAPVKLKAVLGMPADCRIVLAESERTVTLASAVARVAAGTSFCLAAGPEGGWTSVEMGEFAMAGWTACWLGPQILRAETAAIAAMAVVQALGQFSTDQTEMAKP